MDFDMDAFYEWIIRRFGCEIDFYDLTDDEYYELEDEFRKEQE